MVAGREGFEPSMELQTPYSLSRGALSATQPPARNRGSDLSHYRRGSLLWAGPETVNDRAINERISARGYSCPGTGRTETARDLKGPGRLSSCQFMSSVSGDNQHPAVQAPAPSNDSVWPEIGRYVLAVTACMKVSVLLPATTLPPFVATSLAWEGMTETGLIRSLIT